MITSQQTRGRKPAALLAYTYIRGCLTIKHFSTELHDVQTYPCSGLAGYTKYHKIQNDRKYKHQFVFQVYNILFTKIGWEGPGSSTLHSVLEKPLCIRIPLVVSKVVRMDSFGALLVN